MKFVDIIATACIVAALVLAVYLERRRKRTSSCCGDCSRCAKARPVEDRNRANYPYESTAEITGMTCQNCAVAVENALNSIDGHWATVRLDTRTARILSKTPPSEEAIRHAVHTAGYSVASFKEMPEKD